MKRIQRLISLRVAMAVGVSIIGGCTAQESRKDKGSETSDHGDTSKW